MANATSVRFPSAGDVTSGGVSIAAVGTPFVVANTDALTLSGGLDPHATLVDGAVTTVRKVGVGRQCNTVDLYLAWTGTNAPATPPVVRVYGVYHMNGGDAANVSLTNLDPTVWPNLPFFGQSSSGSSAQTAKHSYIVPLDDPTADPASTDGGYALPLSNVPTLTSTLKKLDGTNATYNLGRRQSVYLQGCHDILVHVVTAAGAGASQVCVLARLSS